MTISSENRVAGPYIGNDAATAFPFAFKVFGASDLQVVLTDSDGAESTLTLTSDYTVSLNANQDSNPGGTVTLVAGALVSSTKLTITSSILPLQATDLTNQGGFYPKVITNALDKLTILIQQLFNSVGRQITVPISDGSVNVNLPSAANRASKVLGFDALGGVTTYSPASAVTDAANVTFLPSGTGAISRPTRDKLREVVSVKDFGAVGDGVTDDAAAIQAAINYCMKQYDPTQTTHDGNNANYRGQQKTLYFPAGIYIIKSTLNFSFRNDITMLGESMHNTVIAWKGAANGTMIDARCSNYATFSRFMLDGRFLAKTFIYCAGNGVNAPSSKGNVTGNYFGHIYFWNQIGDLTGTVSYTDQYDPLSALLCTTSAYGAATWYNSMDDSVIEYCRFAPNSLSQNYAIAISSSAISIHECYFFSNNGILVSNGAAFWMSRCEASLNAPKSNAGGDNRALIKFHYGNCGIINNIQLYNCYLESQDYYGNGYSAKLLYMAQGPAVGVDSMPQVRQIVIEGGLYSAGANNWMAIDLQANNRGSLKLHNAAFQGPNKGYIYAPNFAVDIVDSSSATSSTGSPTWQPIPGGYATLNRAYSTPDFTVQGGNYADISVVIGSDDPSRLSFLTLDEALTWVCNSRANVTIYLQKNDTIAKTFSLNSNVYIALGAYTLTINGTLRNFGSLTISYDYVGSTKGGSVVGSAQNILNFGALYIKNTTINNLVVAQAGKAMFNNLTFSGTADTILLGETGDVVINYDNCTFSGTGYVVNLGSGFFGRATVKSAGGAVPSAGKWMRGTWLEFSQPALGFANMYWATANGTGASASWGKIGVLS